MRRDRHGIWVPSYATQCCCIACTCCVLACLISLHDDSVRVVDWPISDGCTFLDDGRRWVGDDQDWHGHRGMKLCSHMLMTGGPIRGSLATALVLSTQWHCAPSWLCNWSHHHHCITSTATRQHQLHWHYYLAMTTSPCAILASNNRVARWVEGVICAA